MMSEIVFRVMQTSIVCSVLVFSISGCGGSTSPTVVTEDADAEEIAKYQSMIDAAAEGGSDDGTE